MRKAKSNPGRKLAALVLSCAAVVSAAVAAPIVYGYQEGLAQATENGLWGFVDTTGSVVVPIRYQSVLDFTLGTALVRTNNKMGLIRQDGAYLLQPEYDTLENLGYGLYLAQKGDQWGVVSILAFPDGQGGETWEFYPIAYDAVRSGRQVNGLDVLVFATGGVDTMVSLSSLPSLMAQRQVPSAQFPLIKGRLPSFSDVGPRDWFAVWVDIAYNVSLMQGTGNGAFSPNQTLTVAEALKLAAFMESQSKGDSFHLQPITGTPWYRSSVAYCEASGVISQVSSTTTNAPLPQAEMARIFAATTLGRSIPERNSLAQVKASVPDVRPRVTPPTPFSACMPKGSSPAPTPASPSGPPTASPALRLRRHRLVWPVPATYHQRPSPPITQRRRHDTAPESARR